MAIYAGIYIYHASPLWQPPGVTCGISSLCLLSPLIVGTLKGLSGRNCHHHHHNHCQPHHNNHHQPHHRHHNHNHHHNYQGAKHLQCDSFSL